MNHGTKLRLEDLAGALALSPQYQQVDVFADDLVPQWWEDGRLQNVGGSPLRYQADCGQGTVTFEVHPVAGVVRASRGAAQAGTTAGAVAGAAIGAAVTEAIKNASQEKGKDWTGELLFGLLVGAAIGAGVGAAVAPRRVFALRYDPQTRGWRAYDGELLHWMKQHLLSGPTAA